MSKLMTFALAGLLLAPGLARAQGGATGTGATAPAPKPLPTAACRVKDYAGGRTCTANVPELACAAIAREAKGQYTWTPDECP
jgi:hypothetical protein